MSDETKTPGSGASEPAKTGPREPWSMQGIADAWSWQSVIHLRYAVRWLWLLFLYFLIGGVVITTIGAFQYQENLFKDVKAEGDLAKKQAEVAAFRGYYERYDDLRRERQRMLSKLREGLSDAEWVQVLARRVPVSPDKPADAVPAASKRPKPNEEAGEAGIIKAPADPNKLEDVIPTGLQSPLPESGSGTELKPGPVKDAAMLVDALLRDQKTLDDHLGGLKPPKQSEFRNLVYLQRLTWMVPFGPQPISLATMPPGLLTFIITITMGALGSLLYVTQYCLGSVIDSKGQTKGTVPFVRPLSWFLFRPLLGMMTALVMFIFIKTGQFSFSDASLSATLESGLNPYLISFLAILSGFMSWQALEMIERNGKKLFGWQAKRDRWAYGLEQALKEGDAVKGESLDEKKSSLAEKLEVSVAQVGKWIAGQQQVNHRQQERIAQILDMEGVETRKLFTDIPPQGLTA